MNEAVLEYVGGFGRHTFAALGYGNEYLKLRFIEGKTAAQLAPSFLNDIIAFTSSLSPARRRSTAQHHRAEKNCGERRPTRWRLGSSTRGRCAGRRHQLHACGRGYEVRSAVPRSLPRLKSSRKTPRTGPKSAPHWALVIAAEQAVSHILQTYVTLYVR